MGLKELRVEIDDEVSTVLGSDFAIEVTRTRAVPHASDPAITFPDVTTKTQGTKLIETCVLDIDIRRSTELNFSHRPKTVAKLYTAVTGGAFPRKVGGENRTVTAGRRPWWPRMAGLQPLSTRAFGPRLRRLTALTALATRPLIATKRSTVRCGQSVCKCHAEKFRSAIFARILTAVHTRPSFER